MARKLLTTLAFLLAYSRNPQTEALEIMCKGQTVTIPEEQMNNINTTLGYVMACSQSLGADSPEELKPEKIGCFSKCMLEKQGLVDVNGKPHQENINNMIDASVPEFVREEVKTKTAECLNEHGGKIDAKDHSCATYVPLTLCTETIIMEICRGS